MATSNNFDYPTDAPVVTPDDLKITTPWGNWIQRVHNVVTACQQSGTTANRPTSGLFIGRTYFDTTLGKPIWVKSVPAKPAPAVWCDAAGLSV